MKDWHQWPKSAWRDSLRKTQLKLKSLIEVIVEVIKPVHLRNSAGLYIAASSDIYGCSIVTPYMVIYMYTVYIHVFTLWAALGL